MPDKIDIETQSRNQGDYPDLRPAHKAWIEKFIEKLQGEEPRSSARLPQAADTEPGRRVGVPEKSADLSAVRRGPIEMPSSGHVPLGDLAEVAIGAAPKAVQRDSGITSDATSDDD